MKTKTKAKPKTKKMAAALIAAAVLTLCAAQIAMACADAGGGAEPPAAGQTAAQQTSAQHTTGGGQAKPATGKKAAPGAGQKPKNPASGSVASGESPQASTLPAAAVVDAQDYSVTISGGYGTDPLDHGRPVALIAAALGVPAEIFREAFSGVKPAGADSGGPTAEEAQANKAALMKVLAPYGITNDRLDEVSNYYRYNGSKGEVWKRTPAAATAIVENGVLKGVKITNAGAGYSSAPTVIVTSPGGKVAAKAEIVFSKDFKTNGSIGAITLP
ncbi:hypothetical protein SAMN05216312_105260 [Cohnella sp. OV330]|uniref:hypothetical protein n=1 Tax=Cohnella sp. OV330 TaxID=1855288 RepID=UPI0008F305DA|nr:hypothetical protein [Cohnella sp. OV330]SFB28832.1 hypothetical protein SAMN05216312_105260 [Cohnella sp. OV330]